MPIREKEVKWKKRLFTVIIFIVLGSSIIGFTFSAIPSGLRDQDSSVTYNGIEFFTTQGGLATVIDEQIFEFSYFPDELANVEIGDATSKISSARMVYTTSDPNSTLASAISGAEFDIARILESNYNTFIEVVFNAGNPYGKNIITCDDATSFVPVVLFNFTNTTTDVTDKNNCIIINVESENALNKVRDKIIYELLEIEP